jgi:hypothetical protein
VEDVVSKIMTTLSAISWLLLLVQVALFAATALAPFWFRPHFLRYFVYSVLGSGIWMGYAVAAMLFDSKVNNDVPGIGYLLPGFLGWLIGTVIFGVRRARIHDQPA